MSTSINALNVRRTLGRKQWSPPQPYGPDGWSLLNDREWWIWNPRARVGYLRIGLTPEEAAVLPDLPAQHDAGDSGPERRRTPARRPA